MAKVLPPYVTATGLINDLFRKIKEAPPPPRFSQDFLFSNLKFTKSGSTIPFIPFLKRIGFLANDGTPTELYKKFRNPDHKISGLAMAQAFKIGYADLYARNEYWPSLDRTDLKNFLVEILEVDAKNSALKCLIATIEALKTYAVFTNTSNEVELENGASKDLFILEEDSIAKKPRANTLSENEEFGGINLSYTINLNLPETSDITVFDAIFKSLKEQLLKK